MRVSHCVRWLREMLSMRWATWWYLMAVLQLRGVAQRTEPTACDDDACRCDSFTRLICNCAEDNKELTLRPDGAYRIPSTATSIIIDSCDRVIFLPDTVRNLIQLRLVEIRNVSHVVIRERSLAWNPFSRESETNPGVRILINNSTINEISSHAIQGRIDDIVISNSRINILRPFAFSSLTGVKTIELTNNIFDNIEIQSFKKFTTLNFILRGGKANTLPSRFLSDVEVTNLFRIEGISIKHLSSLTFLVSLPKRILIESNIIDTLDGDCFHMSSRGPITFRNNTITTFRNGAFLGFTADTEIVSMMGRQELLIDNNTISTLTPASLVYNHTSLLLRLDGLNLNMTCTCQLADEWRIVLNEQGGIINCWYELDDHYISIPTYLDSRCGAFKQTFWIFVVVGVFIVALAAAIVIYFILKRENKKKKKLQIVMPDGKTYRETEFHIVVERAELLTTDL